MTELTVTEISFSNNRNRAKILLDWGIAPIPCTPSLPEKLKKAPSAKGILIDHKKYQKELPDEQEVKTWFSDDNSGIGFLCGVQGLYTIDFDIEKIDSEGKKSGKGFENRYDCKVFADKLFEAYPELLKGWVDKTPSGGIHIAVRLKNKPTFTNFTHKDYSLPIQLGELLGEGRYVVTHPTVGYENICFPQSFEDIPLFDSIEQLGFISASPIKKPESNVIPFRKENQSQDGESFEIAKLISNKVKNIIDGLGDSSDRSKALTTVVKEVFGWDNWLTAKGYQVSDNPQDITTTCGKALGLDSEKVDRILATVNVTSCLPSLHYLKGDDGCQAKLREATRAKNEVKTTPEHTIFTELFQDGEGDFIVMDSVFYQYTGNGYWKALKDEFTQKIIVDQLMLLYKWKKSQKGFVKDFSFATEKNKVACFKFNRTSLMISSEEQKTNYRCFQDCTVDMATGKVLKHCKEHYLTSRIDYPYIQDSEIPKTFSKFLHDSFGTELIELIRAGIAMYLDPTENYDKFLYFVGETGSGKGTVIETITHLIGQEAISNVNELSELNDPDKCHQIMSGKSLVFNEDFTGYQAKLGGFLALTQNMYHDGRALFSSNRYSKKWNVRFLFGATDTAQLENACTGWTRRCILIPTQGSVVNKDTNLKDKIKEEAAQIISWALALDKTVRHKLLNDLTIKACTDMALKQQIDSDTVKAFIDQTLIPSKGLGSHSSDELYSWYKAYAKHTGIKPLGMNKFISRMIQALPMCFVERKQDKNRNWIPRHWVNIRQESFQSSSEEWICSKTSEGYLDMFLNPSDYESPEPSKQPNNAPIQPTVTAYIPTPSTVQEQPQILRNKDSFNLQREKVEVRRRLGKVELGQYLYNMGMPDYHQLRKDGSFSEDEKQEMQSALDAFTKLESKEEHKSRIDEF